MTLAESVESEFNTNGNKAHTSLATAAARNLSTTTNSAPQMRAISPRWLPRALPWVETKGGVHRVNRRRVRVADGARVDVLGNVEINR